MTYKDLLIILMGLDAETLAQNVTVENGEGEYLPVSGIEANNGITDILDEGHIFLKID